MAIFRGDSCDLDRPNLDFDVRSDFENLVVGQVEETPSTIGASVKKHEKMFKQWVHARDLARDD